MTPLHTEFDQNIDDIKAFFANALPRSPIARRQLRTVMIVTPLAVVGGGLFLCCIIGSGFPPPAPWLYFIGLGALAAMYFTPSSVHNQQMKQVMHVFQNENHRKRLGPTKVELRADGVAVASPLGATLIDWKAIAEIVATPTYVFLHLDSLTAVIVPGCGFSDESAFERFIDAAQLYRRNATPEWDSRIQ